MSKLITVKDKRTGVVIRVNLGVLTGELKGEYCFTPKKLWKRQERDRSRIRSKRQWKLFSCEVSKYLRN